MKRPDAVKLYHVLFIVFLSFTTVIAACGGGGGGGGGGDGGGDDPTTPGTTTISGSVSLSSTVTSPTLLKTRGKMSTLRAAGAFLTDATVELYNAEHPEWLYPVAVALTSASGAYTLSTLSHAAENGSAYADGGSIPSGNYTIIAHKYDAGTGKLYVAVQAFVKNFDGVVTGNDLEALDRGAVPGVLSMFGLEKNADGSFGGEAYPLASNAAIQVTFNTAMARLSVLNAISIKDASNTAVNGTWKISADLVNATFYPSAGSLAVGGMYTVTVLGSGSPNAAVNLYNTAIPAAVTGKFQAAPVDDTPPNAVYCGLPTNVPISMPILIAANELLDINTFSISSTPSIGAKPTVIFKGTVAGCGAFNTFGYEIVPSGLFQLDTNYAVTVGGTKDIAGNALTAMTFNFKTETTHAPLTIVSRDPDANATAVPLNKVITVAFSGSLKPDTITSSTFVVKNGASAFPGSVSSSGTTATFIPAGVFANDTTYTVTLTTGIMDMSGTTLQAEDTWAFITQTAGSNTSKWGSAKWDIEKWGN